MFLNINLISYEEDKQMDNSVYAALAGVLIIWELIGLAVTIFILIAWWKIFVKAGKPGWAAIVPFYNMYCMFEMSFGNGWMFLLCFVPCVNVVMLIIMWIKLAQAFGQGAAFGVGLIFLPIVFLPILAFGDSQYYGPA